MKAEGIFWAGGALYFAVIALIYLGVGDDPIGVALLIASTALGGLVAGWIWSWRRHGGGPRPSDLDDSDAADETGVVGVFPTASLRPLALGAGMSAIALGIVLGSWLSAAGAAIVASQVALLVRDSDR